MVHQIGRALVILSCKVPRDKPPRQYPAPTWYWVAFYIVFEIVRDHRFEDPVLAVKAPAQFFNRHVFDEPVHDHRVRLQVTLFFAGALPVLLLKRRAVSTAPVSSFFSAAGRWRCGSTNRMHCPWECGCVEPSSFFICRSAMRISNPSSSPAILFGTSKFAGSCLPYQFHELDVFSMPQTFLVQGSDLVVGILNTLQDGRTELSIDKPPYPQPMSNAEMPVSFASALPASPASSSSARAGACGTLLSRNRPAGIR